MLTVVLFVISFSFGQDTIYLDSNMTKIDSNHIDWSYYKILHLDQNDKSKVIEKIYFKSGQIKKYNNYLITSKKYHGLNKEWGEDGGLINEIEYKDGEWHGYLTTYWTNGVVKRKDFFKDGEFVEGDCFNEKGEKIDHFDYLVMPHFPGGNDRINEYIAERLNYPQLALEQEIQGRVLVRFTVDEEGSIRDVETANSVHELLDQEAIRVISVMPNWIPGERDGEKINVTYILPINFGFN